jgi:hypothetical protein
MVVRWLFEEDAFIRRTLRHRVVRVLDDRSGHPEDTDERYG